MHNNLNYSHIDCNTSKNLVYYYYLFLRDESVYWDYITYLSVEANDYYP